MSIVGNCSVSLPNPKQVLPDESVLVGHETLDHFVRIIALREKTQAKRESLPELSPCENALAHPSLLTRVAKKLFDA